MTLTHETPLVVICGTRTLCRGRRGPCEGGKGHSFRQATVGLELEDKYPSFHKRIVRFLRVQGMQNFTISLVTDYSPDHPAGKSCVYVEGLDLLSEEKRRQTIQSVHRRERRLRRRLRELGLE